ncbi:MAG: uracil-DNA glycosylase [Alphaproteobacteria bacterium]|nr:MAG: uracil-DNA glycosylase [Alphaproteobacteria bacterium]
MTNADLAALEWYMDAGVDIAIADAPNDRFSKQELETPSFMAPEKAPTPRVAEPKQTDIKINSSLIEAAKNAASACTNFDELSAAILEFTDHPLKKTATNMVLGDGNTKADIMVIGDPPSNDEDRSGDAFSGVGGQLLDKILASIDLSREDAYLTHITHWRPPGNSTPTAEHLALSKPFIEKQIDLVAPQHLLILGNVAAKTLLDTTKSMSRVRGEWFEYGPSKIPAIVTYTPDFLLNNPLQKRKTWADILSLKGKITDA